MPKYTINYQSWQTQSFEDAEGYWSERAVLTDDEDFEKEFESMKEAQKWCEENSYNNGDSGANYYYED